MEWSANGTRTWKALKMASSDYNIVTGDTLVRLGLVYL
jgi:hypothetical protein